MVTPTADVKGKSTKHRGQFKTGGDPRRNTAGRPSAGNSIKEIASEIGEMDGPEVAKLCRAWARDFKQLEAGVSLRKLVVVRLYMSAINEPSPGIVNILFDRVDGPVPTKLENDGKPFVVVIDK